AMLRLGQLVFLFSVLGVECIDQNGVRLKRQVQTAQSALRSRLLQLDPEQQQDLAMVVPYLKKGDKAAFKKGLGTMVQNGGNERIKRCLQGLSAIGFDALEIQNWMTHEGVATPQSKMVSPPPASAPASATAVPSVTAALRAPPKAVQPPTLPTVGAMAGLAAEQQLAGGKGKDKQAVEVAKKGEDQVSAQKTSNAQEQGDLAKMTKAQAKKALRKELARRLAKGVQAFDRVEKVEKNEANLQEEVAEDKKRVSQLQEALQQEQKKEAEVEKENAELKHELEEQAAASKKAAARLDALEARGSGSASDSRVAALEDQNTKFRAALAGAARRLINLEADVSTQKQISAKPDGPKVVRHEKKPMPAA
ncbi:unnamed protein product, partial [Symbiodinium pilosum]